MTPDSPRRLVLIDGHADVFKAYYAIKTPLTTSRGEPTHAIHGFLAMFLRLRKRVPLDYVTVVFDAWAPSFRHLALESYKATRRETPPDLHRQVDAIRRVLAAMGVPVVEAPGFEADDVLATLSRRAVEEGGSALVCSVDKDVLQVVSPGITVWREHLGKLEELDAEKVHARMGVLPSQVADYLALVGDSSDNLKGVPGVGEKTAATLLAEYGSLDGILAAAPQMPDKKKRVRESLIACRESVMRTRDLTRLRFDAPVPFSWESAHWDFKPTQELRDALVELEMGRILRELIGDEQVIAPPVVGRAGVTSATATQAGRMPALPSQTADDQQTELFGTESEAGGLPDIPAPATPLHSRPTRYSAVRTLAELDASVAAIRAAGLVAIDTETTGFDPFTTQLVGISLSWEKDQGIYIPVGHNELALGPPSSSSAQLAHDDVRARLNPLFSDAAIRWVAHHWKFDYKVLLVAGFTPRAMDSDTLIAAWLLQPDRPGGVSYSLKSLGEDRLGVAVTRISDLIGKGADEISMADVPIATVTEYAAQDTDLTLQLHHHFDSQVMAAGLREVYERAELPLTPVLAAMELEGVRIDRDYFAAYSRELTTTLARLQTEIIELAGRPFNINSPKQVAEILFGDLQLPVQKKLKGGPSTDVSVLEELAPMHPMPRKLLEFRHFEKLRSTYVDSLPKNINRVTGRVHTSFGQTDAATGRLSSNDPNLQNIPVRTEEGRKVRRGFVPREPGWVLVSADYSQIELRILAHMSGDAALRAAFESGADIHSLTASRMFKTPLAEVSSAQRYSAKAINFGIIYGMSAFRLSRDLEIPRAEAERFMADYFTLYAGVKTFIESMKEAARRDGYVRTLLGRRRAIADINSRNPNARSFAERIAVNSPIQGTSADMIKLAMIRVHNRIVAEKLRARMILQVHDELIFDSPESEAERVTLIAREEMAQSLPLAVPVKVETDVGPNWAEV